MDKAYIREQNFHIATEDEDMEIRRGYKVKNRRTWLKFLGVSVVLVIIGIIFQIIELRIGFRHGYILIRDIMRRYILWRQ